VVSVSGAVVDEEGVADVDVPRPGRSARIRYALAWAAGSLLALVVFVWLVSAGTGQLVVRDRVGDFHDIQARAWLDGHWDVAPEAVTIEGFVTEGRTYVYFGPLPALLRVPVLAVTHRLDGRLTRLSLVAAAVVALGACGVLAWRTRRLLRPDDDPSPGELVAVAVTAFVVGAGSIVVFFSSRAIVYHETTLWAVALSLAAYAALLGWMHDRRSRSLALATLLAVLAMLTRGSVGVGPGIALGLLAAGALVDLVRGRGRSRPPGEPTEPTDDLDAEVAAGRPSARPDAGLVRRFVLLAVAALLPFAAFSAINVVKFRSLWALPLDRQAVTSADSLDGAARRAALADNGGSLFGAKFVPTTALAYVRPDGLGLQRAFPFVRFPDRAQPVGHVTFDTIDPAASATATMPALVVLGALGLVGVVRRRELRPLVPLLGGATAGALTVLTIGFIAHRYVGDLFPLIAVAELAGLALAPTLRPPRALAIAAVALVGVLGLWSVWVNVALALDYQRFSSPNADIDGRAAMVAWQVHLSPREAFDVRRGDDPGPAGPEGSLFVVGDCDGLYRSDGELWAPVERTPGAGHVRLRATLSPRAGSGEAVPVLAAPGLPAGVPLVLRRLDGGRARFEATDRRGLHLDGEPFELDGQAHVVDLVVDPRSTEVIVTLDDRRVIDGFYLALPGEPLTVGSDWATGVEHLDTPTPACDQLVP
jgi:hypothetical protein